MWGSRGERAFQTRQNSRNKGREARNVWRITSSLGLPEHKTQIEQWKDIVINEVSRGC